MNKLTHCRRCNRRLTNPDAVREGIGATCKKKQRLSGEQTLYDFTETETKQTEWENENG